MGKMDEIFKKSRIFLDFLLYCKKKGGAIMLDFRKITLADEDAYRAFEAAMLEDGILAGHARPAPHRRRGHSRARPAYG